MHTAGLILAIFGGVLLVGSAFALSCMKSDNKNSAADTFDMLILGGLIGFFRNLFRAISEGLDKRSSDTFPVVVLFAVSLGLIAIGAGLIYFSGP